MKYSIHAHDIREHGYCTFSCKFRIHSDDIVGTKKTTLSRNLI